jgi:hypothetical protein
MRILRSTELLYFLQAGFCVSIHVIINIAEIRFVKSNFEKNIFFSHS